MSVKPIVHVKNRLYAYSVNLSHVVSFLFLFQQILIYKKSQLCFSASNGIVGR